MSLLVSVRWNVYFCTKYYPMKRSHTTYPRVNVLSRILHPTSMKLYPGYEGLADFMRSLPAAFEHGEGQLIHDGRNQLRILCHEGVEYVVKSYQVPILLNRLVYGFLRPSKAERSLLNAQRLIDMGVGSPLPVGFINIRNGLLFTHSYMVTVRSRCPYRYDMLLKQQFDCAEQLCREVGRCTAVMHEHGMYNMDYNPSNILFDVTPRPRLEGTRYVGDSLQDVKVNLELVDLNRIRMGHVDMHKGCFNLRYLPANAGMHRCMAEEYARVRGFDPEECYRLIRDTRLQHPEAVDWEKQS